MDEILKKLEKEYGLDKESLKKILVIGVVFIALACVGIYMLIDSMKIKVLSYNDLKARVETLWTQAKSKGATTEEEYRKYITDRLNKVDYRQYILNITADGIELVDKFASLNKYGFYFDVPYQVTITSEGGTIARYAIIFREDGTADTYIADEKTQYNLICDEAQKEMNLKYSTRIVTLNKYDLQFSADGHTISIIERATNGNKEGTKLNYTLNTSVSSNHGIYKEYEYVGKIDDEPTAIRVTAGNKLIVAQNSGIIELQVRMDCGEHRIIHEGKVYATMSLDGKMIRIGNGLLQIKEEPYKHNIETPKYPGMKVKLVEGSSIEGIKEGNPKTGDIIMYNDYIYVCNKHYVNDSWEVFNEDSTRPEWGVKASYGGLLANMEDEIYGVPVTMITNTYVGQYVEHPPKISQNAKKMIGTFSGCTALLYTPKIPDSVVDMTNTFWGCDRLTTASSLPEGVEILSGTFAGCYTMESTVKIPRNVVDITSMFDGCRNMTGNLKIDSKKIERYDNCFAGTESSIVLVGECPEEKLRLLIGDLKNVRLASDPEYNPNDDGFTEIN